MNASQRLTIIKPTSEWSLGDLSQVIKYKELFYIFAWRDLKVRYKQTLLGASWAIFQPITQTFVFTIFFGRLAKIPSGELPYSLFVLVGLVFWGFFSGVVSAASTSLTDNEGIIKKVYFPKIILPLSKIIVGFVDFLIALGLLAVVVLYFGLVPAGAALAIIPLGIIITAVASGGLGLFLSAINVKYRDVRFALPFFLQMLIFLTPVIYPNTIIRPAFRYLMAINPMTGVIESTRAVIAGSNNVDWNILGISALSSTVIFLIGFYYFRSTEKFFADIV